MSRAYPGIGLNQISDRSARAALQVIDTYLRDVSADLSMENSEGVVSTALGEPYLVVGALSATLTAERQLVVQTPLSASDGGAGGSYTLSVSFATPSLTLGTANAIGADNQPIRSDATIALFDATVPAASAASASHGSTNFAADAGHAHIFPTTLQSTGTVNTLALTAVSATESTLTSSVVTCNLAGVTTLRPSATNTIAFGGTARRWLAGYFGTTGVNSSGLITTSGQITSTGAGSNSFSGSTSFNDLDIGGVLTGPGSGVSDNWVPTNDATNSLGVASNRWTNVHLSDGVVTLDTSAAFTVKTKFTSSAALSADRTLTIDMSNADRTLDLTGNATLNQDVSTAGSPEFVNVKLNDTATAYTLTLQSTDATMAAARTLTFDVQNGSRTLTIGGNASISQNLDTSSAPQFARLGIGAAAHASVKLRVDDTVAAPSTNLIGIQTNRYGGDTNYCGDPVAWLQLHASGTTYRIPMYT